MKIFFYFFAMLILNSTILLPQSNNHILFTSRSLGTNICQMNGDGSNIQIIFNSNGYCKDVDISSDGSKIIFSSDASTTSYSEVFIMNSDGTGVQQITTNGDYYGSNNPRFYGTSKIWYDRGPTAGVHEWWSMNYDGSNQTQITNWQAQSKQSPFFYFNSDQTKIVYEKGNPSWTPSHDIYISNIDLSGEIRLTNNSIYDAMPKFSSDGSKIVWSQEGDIWVMNSDGTNPQQLTNVSSGQNCYWPAFSMDGSKIYYTYFDGPAGDVYVMNNDGSNKTNITNTPGYDERAYCVTDKLTDVENNYANSIPDNFNLFQNYPNPFNPSTTIRYSIPHSSNIAIKIFDALGVEVETFEQGEKSAGDYELTWQAQGVASGIYFYQLKAGDFISTRKMILLK